MILKYSIFVGKCAANYGFSRTDTVSEIYWRMASGFNVNKESPVKSHKSAVVIIPPENVWTQIQDIRRVHDKAYNRWMPHINLVYPFMPDTDNGNAFLEAADKIAKAVSYFRPFEIHFTAKSFKYFVHRKSCTLWLKPERSASSGTKPKTEECDTEHDVGEMHADVLKIQQIIESQFPGFQDLSQISERGFTPHLSLGQFSAKQIGNYKREFSEKWSDIKFVVDSVHLISREDFHDPFRIRRTIRIGQD